MENSPIWLTGYDNKGKVCIDGNHIFRELYPEYIEDVFQIFKLYKKNNLDRIGIVRTDIDTGNQKLIHKKHLISYPFEWTANMYKDATLFHLNLFLKLDQYGLTLKDALPNNIVFDFCNPVFVDFLSIVQKSNLKNESWLMKDNSYTEQRFAVFDRMFVPFILIPLMAMAEKKYALSRRMLLEQACNCNGGVPRWKDVYPWRPFKYGLCLRTITKHFIKKLLMRHSELPVCPRQPSQLFRILSTKQKSSFIDFCSQLMQFVEDVDVSPPNSGYVSYYDAKGENFNFSDQSCWQDKQKNVAKIMDSEKPDTMLDIGANTGWFSILAARRGIKVISTDIDESSIDELYLYSKQNDLQILPLLVSFNDLTRQVFGMDCSEPEYRDRDFKVSPLFRPATERLKSDMVLCLGLLHHLVLGSGMSLTDVLNILSELTIKTLVLEYVDIHDKLIQEEPSFFKHIHKYSNDTYNIEALIEEIKKHFNSCKVLDSHPETRKLLICRK